MSLSLCFKNKKINTMIEHPPPTLGSTDYLTRCNKDPPEEIGVLGSAPSFR